jgi:hypothetical protein
MKAIGKFVVEGSGVYFAPFQEDYRDSPPVPFPTLVANCSDQEEADDLANELNHCFVLFEG